MLDLDAFKLDEIAMALSDQTDYELGSVWQEFRNVRAECRAVEWLRDQSLVDDEVCEKYLEDRPDPDLP